MNELLQLPDPLAYIKENLNESMSVEASAGCGKTYALVARVCSFLRSGRTSIDRLLLLTFTENAAVEMKERLVAALKEADEPWAHDALEKMPQASIQTIHSFAYEICRQFHDTLSLPENISIVSDDDYRQRIRQYFDEQYDRLGNDDASFELFALCRLLSIRRAQFREIFTQILSRSTFLPGDSSEANDTSGSLALSLQVEKICACAKELIRIVKMTSTAEMKSKIAERLNVFASFAQAIVSANDDFEILNTAFNPSKYVNTRKFSTKKEKLSGIELDIENAIDELGCVCDSSKVALLDTTLQSLSLIATNFAHEFRKRVYPSGSITFDDTIIAARRALELEPIREQIWSRYDSIFVDEFQDTDIHQLSILSALIEDESSDDLGRIFVVGDEKQSIYGFRGATVEGYKDFVRTRPLTRVSLATSRRTISSVVDTINQLSTNIIDEYVDMSSVRDNFDHQKRTLILGETLDTPVDVIREQQSLDVVRTLAQLRGRISVVDVDALQRPCRYSDMTILIRDKTSLPFLTDALQSLGLPYSVDSSSLIWENTLVRNVLAMLTATTQPRDSMAIIAALKSPLFCCTNTDLASYVRSHKIFCDTNNVVSRPWNYRSLIPEFPIDNVVNALTELNELHDRASQATSSEFLHYLLFNRDVFAAFAKHNEEETETYVKFLLHQAHQFDESHPYAHVPDFAAYLARCRKDSQKADTYIDTSQEDRIRIMTIHAAKGLEFPIVAFIPSQKDDQDKHVKVVELKKDSFAVSLNSKNYDSRLAEHKNQLRDTFLEEESRLIYVALTRARDFLVIASHNKKHKQPKSQAQLLSDAVEHFERDEIPINREPVNAIATESDNGINNADIQAELPLLTFPPTVSASSIKPETEIYSYKSSRDFLRRSIAPAIGRAVHKTLNIIPFDASEEIQKLLTMRCAANEGISNDEDIQTCIRYVSAALASHCLHMNATYHRELPISGTINGVFCEGYIDCLIETDDEYIIVDYKTDTIDRHRPMEEKREKHSYQLAAYSLLLQQIDPTKKTSAILLFLGSPDAGEVHINDLNHYELLVQEELSKSALAADI
jgi:ATP-dependent helicase/nuclease subunit A